MLLFRTLPTCLLLGFILVVALLAPAAFAQQPVKYTLIELGALPGDLESMPNAINNRGEIVGTSISPNALRKQRGFYWRNGLMEAMGEIPGETSGLLPTSINDTGSVVGYTDITTRGFIWTKKDGFSVQMPPQSGALSVRLYQINNQNAILGETVAGQYENKIYLRNGVWDFFADASLTRVGLMNNSGEIPVGYGVFPRQAALIYNREDKTSVNLRQLLWPTSYYSAALAINDFGIALCYVDGYYYFVDVPRRSIVSEIPSYQGLGDKFIINNSRELLTGTAGELLFSGGKWYGVADLIPPSSMQGWNGVTFTGMNDAGQIIGQYNVGGKWHGFLLSRDADGDGLPDEWESQGKTYNGLDLYALGARPDHKDIFVYVDHLKKSSGADSHDHDLKKAARCMLEAAFAAAPVENPDGRTGIKLHIFDGHTIEENELNRKLVTEEPNGSIAFGRNWNEFDRVKSSSGFPSAWIPIAHYCIMGHDGIRDNASSSVTLGISHGTPSSDFYLSLGTLHNQVGTDLEQAGIFMHELGHNLGLGHGGPYSLGYEQANILRKPNHLSVMNYSFAQSGLIFDGKDGRLDYSRFDLPDLDENNLDELAGLGNAPELNRYGTRWYTRRRFDFPWLADFVTSTTSDVTKPINWDGSRDLLYRETFSTGVVMDITKDSDNHRGVLRSANEWNALVYRGGLLGSTVNGNSDLSLPTLTPYSPEITEEDVKGLVPLTPTALSARAARGSVRLAWTQTGSSDSRQYTIYRSVRDENFVKIATVAAPLYQDTGLPVGANVRYQIAAVSIYGVESNPSAPVAITVP